ncbi:LytR/AlgR family response regulator transcription factor [Fibrella forsythiae]|uniref:Response regulator n=1 Tax=Fibrella forsythiae TaxID=2817061 RepID=A0ABS3JTQ9_9BACT|nr:response regulator [Fibrella forsythiae]MBO0953348.1 response regulator [Fibrella forsythiae]
MQLLLVEDEDMAARKLAKTLFSVEPTATVVAITGSIQETVDWLRTYGSAHVRSPDLILMDLELADGQSVQIFDQIQVTTPVIFTTSYDEYALRAFRASGVDYLLKPVQKEELQAAILKFIRQRALGQSTAGQTSDALRQLVQALHG